MEHFNKSSKWLLPKCAIIKLFLIGWMFCNPLNVLAGDGIEKSYVSVIAGSTLVTNSTPMGNGVSATLTYASEPGELSKSIRNIITLSLFEESPEFIPGDFTVDLPVTIQYGASSTNYQQIQRILTVSYTKNGNTKYNAKNYFSFRGAEYVKVIVGDPNPMTVGSFDIKKALILQNEMRVTRYFSLKQGVLPASLNASAPAATDDEMNVTWTWPNDAGHTHTQLEWSWLDNDLASTYFVGGVVDPNLLFIRNATRTDLPANKNSYKIPLLYGPAGKLYYRVRAVNIKATGNRADGPWSAIQSVSFAGHENNLNWQASISFAEEGKRKAVIQYFDGSLRSRQTVTKENVNNTTVTSETFYDLQGKPAIQILPAPGINNIIQYQENLNRFNVGGVAVTGDPAKSFDLRPVSTPNNFSPPLDKTSGSSLYYSDQNSEKNNGINSYIPDAEGYPYTWTRYTNDATGRIKSQTGVGAAMRGGKGHETKYYYGNPSQEELDGLFGTEVGNASHYFKNMVLDANGQMSVSYVDMQGRTIATALAGDAPASLQALNLSASDYPNQAGTTITRKLLDPTTNVVKNNSIESISTILVPATTNYAFNYQLNPETLALTAGNGSPICYDCMYNLEFSITDESGDTPPIVKKFNNINASADDNCSTAAAAFKDEVTSATSNNISFTQSLAPGSYTIRKTLTLSDASLQKYQEEYLVKGLVKTEQQIIDSVYTVMQTSSGCEDVPADPCAACTASVGLLPAFKTAYLASIGNPTETPELTRTMENAYKQAKLNCDRLCNTVSQSSSNIRLQMLNDMMPYSGQYARKTGSGSDPIYTAYNIFYGGSPKYKSPVTGYPQIPTNYLTANGEIDQVNSRLNPLPGITPITVEEFADGFNPSWAEALLAHHPEYRRLLRAESAEMKNVADWALTFEKTKTYAQAETNGFIFVSSATLSDPLYVAASGLKANMVSRIKDDYVQDSPNDNILSMWQVAYSAAICKNLTNPSDAQDCIPVPNPNPGAGSTIPPYSGLTTAQKDELWKAFKSLYLSEREKDVKSHIAAAVTLTESSFTSNNYILRFPSSNSVAAAQASTNSESGSNWSWYNPTPGAVPNFTGIPGGNAPASANYGTRCDSHINQWKKTLEECPAIKSLPDVNREALLNDIAAALAAVCKKGTDESNPYGSSTVAPSTPNDGSPRSFEEVINAKLTFYGIAKSNLCNAFVIDYPKPYGKGPALTKEYATTADTCNCNRFSQLKSAATTAGYNAEQRGTLNQYLLATYSDTLTQSLYDGLVNNCSKLSKTTCTLDYEHSTIAIGAPIPCGCWTDVKDDTHLICEVKKCATIGNQFLLSSPQPLPAFLKCGFVPAQKCFTCAQLSTLVAEYKNVNIIPAPFNAGPNFSNTNLTDADLKNNILFAQFVNFRTGFSYTWRDYANAANTATCNLANYASNSGATQQVICANTKPLNDPTDFIETETPCQRVNKLAISMGQEIYRSRTETLLNDFAVLYKAKCMNAGSIEQFTVTYTNKEYHYTLYYYDMAGNLVKTVPPKGVNPDFSTTFTNSVKAARISGTSVPRVHTFLTNYRYNSLNQVIAQNTPDGGSSSFWYDILGRLAVSQNAQQALQGKYSYTSYDVLGRIVEVGQKPQSTAMSQATSQVPLALHSWLTVNGGVREQITLTGYDIRYGVSVAFPQGALDAPLEQYNLRNRVSYTVVKKLYTDVGDYAGTFYSYDMHGNVDKLVQSYEGIAAMSSTDNRLKLIKYDYDLISGKVNAVHYQPHASDQFHHRYTYDAENRLLAVETTRDSVVWERDAAYSYYKHGPLSRIELGQLRVQGLDYAYTLQGWLKGINGTSTGDGQFDIGGDGYATGNNSTAARDVLGLALHYYDQQSGSDLWQDYKSIVSSASTFARPGTGANLKSLYNGNIGAMSVNLSALKSASSGNVNTAPLLYNYQYDQLNRLVSMQAYQGLNTGTNQWTAVSIGDYAETVTYDPSGNIKAYTRNGAPATGRPLQMDALAYNYKTTNNQLTSVDDNATYTSNYGLDIDDQSADNYEYDAMGNMTKDITGGVDAIEWNVYGKIASITKPGSTITYGYDASGNRISKTIGDKQTIYVRDASGNTISVYEKKASDPIRQIEQWMYGSSRLGVQSEHKFERITVPLGSTYGNAEIDVLTRGEKFFELTNHLGNVLATVSDRKLALEGTSGIVGYYKADVTSAQDYYPFGMLMPGRMFGVDESVAGGTVNGTTQVNGHSVPVELSVNTRTGGAPTEYVASNGIELNDGFESGTTDDFSAYIADGSYAGTGNQGGGSGGSQGNEGLYRYGFNGKENDNEVKGTGNQQDYGMRIYDNRLGSWLSVDPLQKKYPGESPYSFNGNNPIYFVDPDGQDRITTHVYVDKNTGKKITLRVTEYGEIKAKTVKVVYTTNGKGWYNRYDWHDVNQTVTHFIQDGKEVQTDIGPETLGAYKTTTDMPWKWFAQWKTAQKNNEWGGIAFYSSSDGTLFGQNQETKKASAPVEVMDIDLLLGALSASKDAAEMETTIRAAVENIFATKEGSKKVDEIVDVFKQIYSLRGNAETGSPTLDPKKLPEDNKQNVENKSRKPPAFKQYFDGAPAPNEKGDGQARRVMPWEGSKPDTIYYDKTQ